MKRNIFFLATGILKVEHYSCYQLNKSIHHRGFDTFSQNKFSWEVLPWAFQIKLYSAQEFWDSLSRIWCRPTASRLKCKWRFLAPYHITQITFARWSILDAQISYSLFTSPVGFVTQKFENLIYLKQIFRKFNILKSRSSIIKPTVRKKRIAHSWSPVWSI